MRGSGAAQAQADALAQADAHADAKAKADADAQAQAHAGAWGRGMLVGGVCALLVGGCGPSGEDVPLLRSERCANGECEVEAGVDAGPIEIPDQPLEDWDTTGAGVLTGIFAVEAIITARAVIEVETRQLLRLRIVQHGRELRQKTTLCAFRLPSVEGVAELSIPPALADVIRTKSFESTGDYLSNPDTLGADYLPTPSVVVVGADLANPATDPLPTDEDPALAIDEDADGNPGVTLLADTVTCETPEDLYVALRTSVAMRGEVETLDRIAGTADVSLDQSVLGYSDECMAAAAKIRITIEPGSPFSAVRVGDAEDIDQNGNVSCPEIELNAAKLFGDYWGK